LKKDATPKKASPAALEKKGKSASGGGRNDSAEDYTDDEDKGEEGDKAGGYHPVRVL